MSFDWKKYDYKYKCVSVTVSVSTDIDWLKVDAMESSSYYFISCIDDSVCKGSKLAWLKEFERPFETTLLVYTLFLSMVLLLL